MQKSKQVNPTYTVATVIADINSKCDFIDLVLNNCEKFLKGPENREEYINTVFSFIEFVIKHSRISLQFSHIEKMNHLFVINGQSEAEKNRFFLLLTKEDESQMNKRFLLDDKVRQVVFEKLFCHGQLSQQITACGFSCFKKLFVIVNEKEGSLSDNQKD